MAESAREPGGAGILQSLRNLAATTVDLLRTRLELLSTEIDEERVRLLQVLFWGAAALFFLGLGILLLVVLAVILLWDSHRIAVIVALACAFIAAGAGMAVFVRGRVRERPRVFSSSLEELARDKEQLKSS